MLVAAIDMQLDRSVALKFLLPEYSQHAEAASRFLREARAVAKIRSDGAPWCHRSRAHSGCPHGHTVGIEGSS